MTETSIAKNQKCVQMRSGVEIWIDAEVADAFQTDLENGMRGFARLKGRSVNPADIVGVFFPEDMEHSTRRKNGEWKCHAGLWHQKFEKCECPSKELKALNKKISEAIKACGKCAGGWLKGTGGVSRCPCTKELVEALDKMTRKEDN